MRRKDRIPFALLAAVCLGGLLAGCGLAGAKDVRIYLEEPFPKKMSSWRLFLKTRDGLKPNQRVIPYDLNTPLFSDYASKYRFIWMPVGVSAEYRDDGPFELPVGTILVKSFAFPVDGHLSEERWIETRLLVHARRGWVALPYVWDAAHRDAMLQIVPDPVPIRWTDVAGRKHDFTYHIPNTNECAECHDNQKVLLPIGPKARNLNKSYVYPDGAFNQIAYWTQMGYLRGAPAPSAIARVAKWNDPSTGSVEQRVLAYLDNNCAHCHQPGGTAGYTGVDYRVNHVDFSRLGICKRPNSAGNTGNLQYDIVPGHPELSVLIYRLESTAPKIMMPQISRAVVHEEGVALLREWIAGLRIEPCGVSN